MCTLVATHAKYLWYEDDTTSEIKSDEKDKIVDTYKDQSEVETDQNHNYVEML